MEELRLIRPKARKVAAVVWCVARGRGGRWVGECSQPVQTRISQWEVARDGGGEAIRRLQAIQAMQGFDFS